MKRKYLIPLLLLLLTALLAGCCSHEWKDADCKHPQTCAKCGETKGEALGHQWKDADCENPKTCSVCGDTKGEAKGHQWKDADCETPKTCSVCGKTEGEAPGHQWKDADCQNPKTCSVCGKTEGSVADHDWIEATYTEPKTCSVCGKTEGEPLEMPVEVADLGISVSDFADRLNIALASAHYKLVPGDDINTFVVVTEDGNKEMNVTIGFIAADENSNVIMVLGICYDPADPEAMNALGAALGGSMVLADNTITPDEIVAMLTGEPTLEDDGSYTYSFTKNGIQHTLSIIEAESMAVFGIYPETLD